MNICGKTLHPHQLKAVEWMAEREEDPVVRGGFLCDEMGLGKTITTAALLMHNPVANTLLLMPLAVVAQWTDLMLQTGCGVYTMVNNRWVLRSKGAAKPQSIYITNYNKLTTNGFYALDQTWNRLVLDEAHTMRNYKSKAYTQLKKITATRKWFLTGTPIVNRVSDLSALMHLLNRSILPNTYSEDLALDWMANYALQRTTEQIRELLPGVLPTVAKTHYHRLDFINKEEEEFYKRTQTDAQMELEHILAQQHVNMLQFLSVLLRLRQISTHPQVYIEARRKALGARYTRPNWVGDSSKTKAMVDILRSEKEGHGYVVFCHFDAEIALLKKRLEKETCVSKVLVYNGSMSADQREAVIAESKKLMKVCGNGESIDKTIREVWPKLPLLPMDVINYKIAPMLGRHVVLLAQIQSAGTGINLQHMDRAIFTTPWWTAALMDQAVGRIVRLGQEKPVEVHHLAHNEEEELSETINIDDYINVRVEAKRDLCERLLRSASHAV